jgi:hypothetical protein
MLAGMIWHKHLNVFNPGRNNGTFGRGTKAAAVPFFTTNGVTASTTACRTFSNSGVDLTTIP